MFKFWYKHKDDQDWFEMDMIRASVHSWEVEAKAQEMEEEGWITTFSDPYQE